jgi:hypothetical protein
MAIDNGAATGSAELFLGYPPTVGIEVHVGNPVSYITNGSLVGSGVNPEPPFLAPYVDPSQCGCNSSGNPVVPTNATYTFGGTATVIFVNPAAILLAAFLGAAIRCLS